MIGERKEKDSDGNDGVLLRLRSRWIGFRKNDFRFPEAWEAAVGPRRLGRQQNQFFGRRKNDFRYQEAWEETVGPGGQGSSTSNFSRLETLIFGILRPGEQQSTPEGLRGRLGCARRKLGKAGLAGNG